MDSVGSLIDKLITTDTKLWDIQEEIYEIRRLTFEEYKQRYFETLDGARKLWELLKKGTDLNVSRASLVQEIDTRVAEMIKSYNEGKDLDDGQTIHKQYKTY